MAFRIEAWLLVVALSTLPSALSAQAARPISIGGSADEDACAAVGKVKGLKPKGTLAVRTGPGRFFASVDEVRNGQLLYVCDSSKDGTWLGVVYARGNDSCGVTSPVAKRQVYKGNCKRGWVRSDWVEIVAG